MGIKNFSKVFNHNGEVKYKDMRNKVVAVDAMYQLHRTAHPFKTVKNAILTAPDGTSTNHINGLLALIFNLKKVDAKQVWVFDNPGEEHNSLKIIEIERRRSCKEIAQKKLQLLDEHELFSDDDNNNLDNNNHLINKNKYQRASFSLEIYMINDLKFMLDCFDIPWIEAPIGYEAEQLAAYLTFNKLHGIKADIVLTPDPDCLLFGAKIMIKHDKQKLYKYELSSLLDEFKINQDDLIKIGIKSVIKKFKITELSHKQHEAFLYFKKPICPNALKLIKWNISEDKPFNNQQKINELFNWITNIKGFNESRTRTRFNTAKIIF